MVTVARTYAPLPFGDLEPKRFEDLVRLVAYDFRPWKSLEATGRSGSDEGFDARAEEHPEGRSETSGEDDEYDSPEEERSGRIWAIQCKREKTLGPTKGRKYARELPQGCYGAIFAAAADFSKATRDAIREVCASRGYQEVQIWGKAEIEDMLYQPKNDHLLFAFFGISLQTRRRSLAVQIRSRLTTKKRLRKLLEDHSSANGVLLRDAADERYPHLSGDASTPRKQQGSWNIFRCVSVDWNGLRIETRRWLAFVDPGTGQWDYCEHGDRPNVPDDPWSGKDRSQVDWEKSLVDDTWNQIPEQQRALLEVQQILPFEAIVAIDDSGDNVFEGAHIYTTPWNNAQPPFLDEVDGRLRTVGTWPQYFDVDMEKRVQHFDKKPPSPEAIATYRAARKARFKDD